MNNKYFSDRVQFLRAELEKANDFFKLSAEHYEKSKNNLNSIHNRLVEVLFLIEENKKLENVSDSPATDIDIDSSVT